MTAYSPAQIKTAKLIFDFWKAKGCTDIQAAAWCGNIDGECSFEIHAGGDKVNGEPTAFGIAQDHMTRVTSILRGSGIDMRKAGLAGQLAGIFWEVTDGPYRHVFPAFHAANTVHDAIAVLVSRFEQSGSQARDIARRTALAEQWLATFGAKP